MSYIDSNLLPDERILFRTRKSLIIYLLPVVMTIFAFYAGNFMHKNAILVKVEWVPWLIALLLWATVSLNYFFSEFAVTNKRVMMREGFFYRHSNEMRLTAISQVNVDQSFIGLLLNFGTVSINAFGAFDYYPTIDRPFQFQKAVNEQLDKVMK